jgi:hypothetical protein
VISRETSSQHRDTDPASDKSHAALVLVLLCISNNLCFQIIRATSTFGNLRPAAEGDLQNLATVVCSTGVVDRGVWLRFSVNIRVVLLFVVVALFSVTTTVVSQKVLGTTFMMVQLCHSNDFRLL